VVRNIASYIASTSSGQAGQALSNGRRSKKRSPGVAAIRSTWTMEKRLIPDACKRLVHQQVGEHFAPFAGVSHVRQIETPVRHVRKSLKAVFEKR